MSEQFDLGPYTVRVGLRKDNPMFPRFLIFKGAKFIGEQFSRPCQDDCRWLEIQKRERLTYAECSSSTRDERRLKSAANGNAKARAFSLTARKRATEPA